MSTEDEQDLEDEQTTDLVQGAEDEEFSSPPTAISRMMAMFGIGPGNGAFHPVFDKFNDNHVDKFLDQSHKEDMERLRLGSRRQWFTLAYVLIALLALGWLIMVLLPQDKDLLAEILRLGVAFAGGVGGGYGLKSYQESRRRE